MCVKGFIDFREEFKQLFRIHEFNFVFYLGFFASIDFTKIKNLNK